MNRQPLTVDQVVALAKSHGPLVVNPLKNRRWRGTSACFRAAKEGRLRKERWSCGEFYFYARTLEDILA